VSVGRRGFLRLLGAAPVALPVVAREAATKAGIGAVGVGMSGAPEASYGGSITSSEGDWIASVAKRVFSKDWEDEERERLKRWNVTSLDPDLASSRSLSLSAAMNIQRARNIEKRIASERADARRSYLRHFKVDFLGLMPGDQS
jgi:hypothetical protein